MSISKNATFFKKSDFSAKVVKTTFCVCFHVTVKCLLSTEAINKKKTLHQIITFIAELYMPKMNYG